MCLYPHLIDIAVVTVGTDMDLLTCLGIAWGDKYAPFNGADSIIIASLR